MEEIWRDVKDYPDVYEVSNLGNVRSKDRYVDIVRSNGRPYRQHCKGKQLKLHVDKKQGYVYAWLQVQPKPKNATVHRLVAEAFVPNPDNKCQVNHIDGDKTNNAVENLEWVTASENIQHAHHLGLTHPNTSGLHIGVEVSKRPVEIPSMNLKFGSRKECDIHFNLPEGTTSRILRDYNGERVDMIPGRVIDGHVI